ncbi:MAG: ATP-binding protein [Anaerolineales bacterium]
MSEKIDETLKKIAAGMQTGKTPQDSVGEGPPLHDLPGDPNCPICGGVGYLRQDLPVGHPDFGQLQICSCRNREVSQNIRDRLFELSNLDELAHLTFENFQPRGRIGLRPAQADSLEAAYNHARMFAEKMEGWLLLQGEYGCGKTHLAAAIANFAVDMGVPTLFITVPDLLDMLRFAYNDPETTFETRFEQIRSAPLLVMDDFGTQNATPWAQEKLFQIVNYRYINRLPLVVTTNLILDEIEERIQSRLEDPELVTHAVIQAPDYRVPITEKSDLSSIDYYHRMTFATFTKRDREGLSAEHIKSLEKAFAIARDFAEHPRGWLVITGGYSTGKTHLAAAIANYRSDLGIPVMFAYIPDMLQNLRATFQPSSTTTFERRFDMYRKAPFLVLDDLGSQSITAWSREKIYMLFNYRYVAELPTVITTPDFKDEMDPRLLSRMQDVRLCTICAITAPGYKGIEQKPSRRRNTSY